MSSSVQQQAPPLNEAEKAKVDEAIDEAKSYLSKDAKVSHGHLVPKVVGAIHNNQDAGVMSFKTHSYRGDFLANNPEIIPKNGSGAFVHQGPGPQLGSKGAVIYAHYLLDNNGGGGLLGWLLAWKHPSVSIIKQPSKVYVEAGSLNRLEKLEWAAIERNLDASNNISRYWDSETGAAASAEIRDQDAGYVALVGANFDIKKSNDTP